MSTINIVNSGIFWTIQILCFGTGDPTWAVSLLTCCWVPPEKTMPIFMRKKTWCHGDVFSTFRFFLNKNLSRKSWRRQEAALQPLLLRLPAHRAVARKWQASSPWHLMGLKSADGFDQKIRFFFEWGNSWLYEVSTSPYMTSAWLYEVSKSPYMTSTSAWKMNLPRACLAGSG